MSPQELQVWGKFQEDSVKIGQTIHYSLWVQHRGKNELFFPNAQINVAPFEIIQKDYFKTKMIRPGVYVDSAVYQMRLFSYKIQRCCKYQFIQHLILIVLQFIRKPIPCM